MDWEKERKRIKIWVEQKDRPVGLNTGETQKEKKKS